MNEAKRNARDIFCAALDLPSAVEQDEYVVEACGDDAGLRQRVEALLRADRDARSFLAEPEEQPMAPTVEIAAASRENPGDLIGPYKLLQQIGEGGFGVVYMAEQQKPVRRKVALKVIKPGMDTKEVIARFEAERQALALMDHPNIAKVLDAGATDSGRPYFVMELVKGIPLIEFCDSNKLTTHKRLELFVTVCGAIQHAHHKGVIHRDLKPSNVMVTLHDGKPVPKVIDFGVSKAISQQLTEKTLFTAYGQMIGTPVYMSPEQAEMSGLDIDTRSDIYSLGVLLYELLTGTTPLDVNRLRKSGYAEMQRLIREEEPPRPSTRLSTQSKSIAKIAAQRGTEPKKLGQIVRGDLDWIVMKALEKDRERRYDTANGFAADVERFMNDEPVVACPPSAVYRLRKFSRRHRTVLATTVLVAAALVAGTAVSIWQACRANRQAARADNERMLAAAGFEREKKAHADAEEARAAAQARHQQAENARKLAEALRQETRRELYASEMRLASQAFADGNIEHMNELLIKHWPTDDERDLRGFEWDCLAAAGNLQQSTYTHLDYWSRGRIMLSPDKETMVMTTWPNLLTINTFNDAYQIVNSTTRILTSHLDDLAFSENGRFLAEGCVNGRIRIWDCRTWEEVADLDGEPLPGAEGVMSVAFSPNQNILASGGKGSPIIFWDTSTWMRTDALPAGGNVQDLAFSVDGKYLVSGDSDGRLFLCDVSARRIAGPVNAHAQAITSIDACRTVPWARAPEIKLFATGSEDGTVRLWNDRLEAVQVLQADAPVSTLRFSWNGKRLAAGTAGNNSLLVWDMELRNEPKGHLPIHTIKAHSRKVTGIEFAWSHKLIWSVSEDGLHKFWILDELACPKTIADVLPATRLAYSADGRTLFYQDEDGALRALDAFDSGEARRIADARPFDHLAFSADGTAFAGTCDGQLQVWDLTTDGGKQLYHRQEELPPDSRTAVTGNGSQVAWTLREGDDFHVYVYDCDRQEKKYIPPSLGHVLEDYLVHEWPVFSPDGRRLLGQRHSATFIWDVAGDVPGQLHEFVGWGPEFCGAFSPDGRTVAIGSNTHDIRLHDAVSGDPLSVLQGHASPVLAVAFLGNRRLISGDESGVLRIWDAEHGRLLGTLDGHRDAVTSIACSRQGDSVASSSRDGVVNVWMPSRSQAEAKLMPARGDAFIRQKMWPQAADAYQQVMMGLRNPDAVDAPQYWLAVATLLAKGGDKEGYRRHCVDLLTNRRMNRITCGTILRACSLYPDVIGGDQLPTEKAVSVLERETIDQTGDSTEVNFALAALHKGDARQALDRLPTGDSNHDPLRPLVAALAQVRLGRFEEARQSLEDAGKRIDPQLYKSRTTHRRHLRAWERWLRLDFLRRQTEALLPEKPSGDRAGHDASR